MPKKEKEDKFFDPRILSTILNFNIDLDKQLISKTNFMFGATTLIAVFILNRLIETESSILSLEFIPLLILLVGSLIASVISLLVVLPKMRMFSKKERFKQDVFYYKNILKFYSRDDYKKYLSDLPNNRKKVTEAYSNQIYSLANNIIPYKSRMLKISGRVLIISIFLSLFSYVLIDFFIL